MIEAFRQFVFPLNIYACALHLERGKVDYLHYGLFRDEITDFTMAQEYSTELVMARFPAAPSNILEVGIGLGTTLARLKACGYTVTGVTPDVHQARIARERCGHAVDVVVSRFEDFDIANGPYERVLFQESGQYIDTLDLLEKTCVLLTQGGELIILDEFALKRTEPGYENLHHINHFIAQAERFGLRVEEHRDLSREAVPTLDYLLRLTQTHRTKLREILQLDEAALDALDASNLTYRAKYNNGRFGYALLRLRRSTSPRWRIGAVSEEHVPAVRALFREAFGQEMGIKLWEWKYGTGRGNAIGAWGNGQLVAHYGGMTRDILFFGERQQAVQIGDVMVHSGERGTLTRKGPFFLTAASYLEKHIGFGTRHLIGFGFPNERVMALAERLGLYGDVGYMVEVVWEPLPCKRALRTRARWISLDTAACTEAVESLWIRMSENLKDMIIGIRDSNYLKQRYLKHPDKRYQCLLVTERFTGRPWGLAILCEENGIYDILDVVAPLRHIPRLISHVRKAAGCEGAKSITLWITKNCSHFFTATGGSARDLGIRIPSNIWSEGPPLEQLRERWWLTGGDVDAR